MEVETGMQKPELPKPKGWLHYGYVVVLGGFLTQFILLICQRGISIALVNVQNTLHISFAEVGLISSYYGLIYAAAGFLWGWLADHEKVGPRLTLTGAGACSTAGLILFGLLGGQSLGMAIATYSLAGLGCAGIFIATVPKLIASWFVPEKRGHAMRFITPGGGIASMILGVALPIGIAGKGWETTFVILGCIAGVVTLGFFFLLRDDPAQMGLTPVGAPPGTQVKPAVKKEKQASHYGTVLKMGITWKIGIMYIIYQLGWMAHSTYYVASIVKAGFSIKQAGLVVTMGAIVSILAMQFWGPLSDKWERKTVIAISSFSYAIAALVYVYFLLNGVGLIGCYVLVCIMLGLGAITPVIMAAFGDYFPAHIRGTSNGVISTMSMVGRYGGPFLAGMCIDAGGGKVAYGFIFAAAMMVLSGLIALTWPKLRGKA